MVKEKKGKNTYPSLKNELIKIMGLSILRDIASNIHKGVFYTIMAEKITDSSNQEQFVLCLRWVDVDLNPHEEFICLHIVPNICADTLVARIRDVLIRMNLTLKNYRGQCYDGAIKTCGPNSRQLKSKPKSRVFSHCYGHTLQLVLLLIWLSKSKL